MCQLERFPTQEHMHAHAILQFTTSVPFFAIHEAFLAGSHFLLRASPFAQALKRALALSFDLKRKILSRSAYTVESTRSPILTCLNIHTFEHLAHFNI
eukprot:6210495-Pleurochrysis_carterae.AAC.1